MKLNWIPLLPCALCPSLLMAQQVKKPNVVVIMADDLGYGDLSCNGSNTVSTPNVDRLANSGMRFTDAHAVAATSTPSRYSFLTGHYSWRRKDTGVAPGDAGMIIRPEQYTVADLFEDNGYATCAIGKWHLGLGNKTGEQNWNEKISPNLSDIGFGYSYIMAATADRVPCVYVENGKVANYDASAPIEVSYRKPFPGVPTGKDNPELLYNLKPSHGHDQAIVNGISRIGYMKGGGKALWKDEHIADSIVAHAIEFIKSHKDEPFFLYCATNDIHVPRFPNERFRGKSGMGYRGDAILQFDWSVGKLLDTLDELGLTENTLVVLTSDNGPVVDDGYKDRAVELLGDHRPWGPYRGSKYSNFEAGTRVPFIVSWPGKVGKGVSSALISQIDFLGTMAEMLGATLNAEQRKDSNGYLDSWLGKSEKGRDYIIESAGALSVSDGEWKYITPNNKQAYNAYTNVETGNCPSDQLYNLKQDIAEKNNLAGQYPDEVQRLKKILQNEIEKH